MDRAQSARQEKSPSECERDSAGRAGPGRSPYPQGGQALPPSPHPTSWLCSCSGCSAGWSHKDSPV